MTLHEAYIKARHAVKGYGLTRLVACTDYGKLWGFEFVPSAYDENDESTWFGGGNEPTINKITGEIGFLSWPKDINIFDTGKPIPIDQFFETASEERLFRKNLPKMKSFA